jgi:hypothetical protein
MPRSDPHPANLAAKPAAEAIRVVAEVVATMDSRT